MAVRRDTMDLFNIIRFFLVLDVMCIYRFICRWHIVGFFVFWDLHLRESEKNLVLIGL